MIEGKDRYLFVGLSSEDIVFGCLGSVNKLLGEGKGAYILIAESGNLLEHLSSMVQVSSDLMGGIREVIESQEIEVVLFPSPLEEPESLRLYEETVKLFPSKVYGFYPPYGFLKGELRVEVEEEFLPLKDEELKSLCLCKRKLNSVALDLPTGLYEVFSLPPKLATPLEVINHITGLKLCPPLREELKAKLEFGEAMVGYTEYIEKEMSKISAKNSELNTRMEEMNKKIKELTEKLAASEWAYKELEEIKNSNFYKLAQKYYNLREKLLPPGSKLRLLYERLVGRF